MNKRGSQRRTPDLKPAGSLQKLAVAESMFDVNLTSRLKHEEKNCDEKGKKSRNIGRAVAMLHTHHQKSGSNTVIRPAADSSMNVLAINLAKVNRSSEFEPRYSSQPRTREEIPLVGSTSGQNLVPKLNLALRNSTGNAVI